MAIETLTDAELISRAQKTENYKSAIESLYPKYYRLTCSIAYRIIKNYEDAGEIAQDCMMNVYKNLGKFDASKNFGKWIKRIVYNKSIDYFRRKRDFVSLEDIEDMIDSRHNPEQLLKRKESSKRISEAISSLDTKFSEIGKLLLEGATYPEIAEMMEINPNTARWRGSQLRKKLKKKFNGSTKNL